MFLNMFIQQGPVILLILCEEPEHAILQRDLPGCALCPEKKPIGDMEKLSRIVFIEETV